MDTSRNNASKEWVKPGPNAQNEDFLTETISEAHKQAEEIRLAAQAEAERIIANAHAELEQKRRNGKRLVIGGIIFFICSLLAVAAALLWGISAVSRGAGVKQQVKALMYPDDAFEWNEHHYYLYDNCSSWDEAEKFCEELGGHLATFTSQEENDAVYRFLLSRGYKSAYFGLSDQNTEGTFLWVTNETTEYTNWHRGEPNAENSSEDYAMFYYKFSDGQWNDGDFGGATVGSGVIFICEWE